MVLGGAWREGSAQTPAGRSVGPHELSLRYALDANFWGSVSLIKSAEFWTLEVHEQRYESTTAGRVWKNQALWPASHPKGEQSPSLAGLQLEADGFAVEMAYPIHPFVETYLLTFEHRPASAANSCPVRLIRYRHEQRYLSGGMRSGLVADFRIGMARHLAIEGTPPATAFPPVRLLPRETCLTDLPSVFEGIPMLDVPRVR